MRLSEEERQVADEDLYQQCCLGIHGSKDEMYGEGQETEVLVP